MYTNPVMKALHEQRVSLLVQADDLANEIKDKTELLALVREKLNEIRHALNGADMVVKNADAVAKATEQLASVD